LTVPPLPPGYSYLDVVAGDSHIVARISDGSAIAWGWNAQNQGNVPPLPGSLTYAEISTIGTYNIARRSDGSLVDWGTSGGVPGLPLFIRSNPFVEVSMGGFHAARRADSTFIVWAPGGASVGQLNVPPLPPGMRYIDFEIGGAHGLARRNDGSVVAWGYNSDGQANVPAIPPGVTFVELEAWYNFNFARLSDGSVIAWGADDYHQLEVPPAPPGYRFVELAAQSFRSMARLEPYTAVGTPFCFGDGSLPTPCPCVPPNTVPNPSAFPGHGCANSFNLDGALLTASGTLSPDTVVFECQVAPVFAAFGFLLKGNANDANGVASSDGIRCAGGQILRFGGHNAGSNGAEQGMWTYPNLVQTNSVSASTLQPAGQSAYYQLFYRNAAPSFCNASTANLSNGIQLDWPP
jgi:hypothetical protein